MKQKTKHSQKGSVLFSIIGVIVLTGTIFGLTYFNSVTNTIKRMEDQISSQQAHYAAQAELANQLYHIKYDENFELGTGERQFGESTIFYSVTQDPNPENTNTYIIESRADANRNTRSIKAEITKNASVPTAPVEIVFVLDTSGSMFEKSSIVGSEITITNVEVPKCAYQGGAVVIPGENNQSTCEPLRTATDYVKSGITRLLDIKNNIDGTPEIFNDVKTTVITFDSNPHTMDHWLGGDSTYNQLLPLNTLALELLPKRMNYVRPSGLTNLEEALEKAHSLFDIKVNPQTGWEQTADTARFIILITDFRVSKSKNCDLATNSCGIQTEEQIIQKTTDMADIVKYNQTLMDVNDDTCLIALNTAGLEKEDVTANANTDNNTLSQVLGVTAEFRSNFIDVIVSGRGEQPTDSDSPPSETEIDEGDVESDDYLQACNGIQNRRIDLSSREQIKEFEKLINDLLGVQDNGVSVEPENIRPID